MDYIYFPQEYIDDYKMNGTLLNHSRISFNNRARLFSWLSEECSKQRISRYSFVLTCSYLDLYFMKKNNVQLKDYQLLALGALILATKQVQIQGKIPIIDLKLFKADQLLDMEKNIVFGLDFYLNPPIYIQLLNNIAKLWDIKCQNGAIQSNIRYLNQNKESFLRMKVLYEKMDCLNLFKRVLEFSINEIVATLFYLQTKIFSQYPNRSPNDFGFLNAQLPANSEDLNSFDLKFESFLHQSQIKTKPNKQIEQIILMLKPSQFCINDIIPSNGKTFTQLLSLQMHNKYAQEFYKTFQAVINTS